MALCYSKLLRAGAWTNGPVGSQLNSLPVLLSLLFKALSVYVSIDSIR